MNRSLQVIVLVALAQACNAGQPKPVENAFIKMEAAGQTMKTDPPNGSTLGYAFSFTLKKPIHLTRVQIDDVTTNPPIQLVDDKDPKLKKNNLWAGDSSQIALNPQNFPWMFDGKNSKRVARIVVSSPEAGEFSLNQPMLFDRRTKNFMLRLEQGSHKPKRSG